MWVKSLAEKKCFDDDFELYTEAGIQAARIIPNAPETELKQPPQTAAEITAKTPQNNPLTTTEVTAEIEVAQAVTQGIQPDRQTPVIKFSLNHEYFPVTRRQLRRGWRYLRYPIRSGIAAELDVDATVKRISQQGFFLEPVLASSRANKIELILLIDQSNSMLPFHNLAERLIATARDGERVGQVKVYYFNNAIRDFLYLQPNLEPFKKDKITDLTIHWHQNRTTILIFSDGGAARGGFNPGRIRLTREFFGRIKPMVKQVTWLNPIPQLLMP
ncbi:VWA domain-containing protein [Microseira wollei]|uniref:VWA containing CoxE family protein n=1 Tax=Microseira wollei NIES-4236 TaxID=2530354 RepID=A0AAV3XJ79_9CYAN|nr:VWA domain-containing protein [Microseira wollei]GET40477.1 VWA containing CoxE family protein [Microseira wollei NIES-4236]